MKGMKYVVSTLLAGLVMAMASTGPAAADPLAELQWKNRVLLLFAKSRSDASLDRQVDLLRDYRTELRERTVVAFDCRVSHGL